MLFLLYIFWDVQIIKNHVFCCNFSCLNVCEIRICHLLKIGVLKSVLKSKLSLHHSLIIDSSSQNFVKADG